MSYLFTFVIALIIGGWFFLAARLVIEGFKKRNWKGFVRIVAAMLLSIGGLGFFGTALFAVGTFNWLPNSFEWPIGYSTGIVSTKDHYFVVPHDPTGRVQIYDTDWKFLRGWNVDAAGGRFQLQISETNLIHVITARKQMHYIYDLNGKLVSSENYAGTGKSYSSFPHAAEAHFVPTPFYLLMFSSPFYSWLVAMAGMVILVAMDKMSKRKTPA